MDLKQPAVANHFHNNVYPLPIGETKDSEAHRYTDFKSLVSQARRHQKVQTYLMQEAKESEAFAHSNKAIRKLENMIDVINFSLFDFELMHERYHDAKLLRLLEDIISILKCTKTTLSQVVVKGTIDFKTCGDTYIMAIYAAIKTINSLMGMVGIVCVKLLDDLENMQTSLIYAIDEHLG